MKKVTILSILSFTSAALFAQDAASSDKHNSFELQAKGSYNSTWLFNKNISDADASQNYANAWGYNYGLGFNAYFGNVGVGIDALMGNHVGGYSGVLETKDSAGVLLSKENYKSNVNLSVIQIPVMFKLRSQFGAYLEVGPQFNMVSSAKYSYKGNMSADTVATSYYSTSYISAVLGFGFKIKFGDGPLSLDAGLRLNYGFTDLKGVDGLGRDLNNSFNYKTAAPTNAVSGGLMVALTYQLNHKKK